MEVFVLPLSLTKMDGISWGRATIRTKVEFLGVRCMD